MTGQTVDRSGLERPFGRVVVGFTLSVLAIALGVGTLAGTSTAVRWAIPTAAVAAIALAYCYRLLEHNHPAGASRPAFDSLGVANHVTLARGGLFAAIAGFAFLEPTRWIGWLPALLYGAGSALDAVDGFLARMNGRTTVLGAKLDMAFDSVGFVVGPVVAVLWGRLPVWYLSLSVARYLFLAGKTWRQRRGRPVFELPESRVRRPLAGFQMAFITVALAPLVSAETIHTLAVVALLPSLLVFLRDYLVVSGRRGGGEQY
ncbi:Phosphatidylglycerophosphate synthase [Halanaeroarchaeum sp. HSR-CO]|uniref:CDP-alcohol phosphatidyltransferase family protein n=1 Tax=Halanaeroarchaeum sp. HSR-CO TaxID=2866382 RepID=UPI00217DE08B|nr:CDP-alcohol phosphatidyltransferase family protein [Halanaeroarchaeum sp. HSR-CO]UWG48385.1 Phosphatidylglycerophosphate synthase [Halanaeroarchaeum sp. HSR-CO]